VRVVDRQDPGVDVRARAGTRDRAGVVAAAVVIDPEFDRERRPAPAGFDARAPAPGVLFLDADRTKRRGMESRKVLSIPHVLPHPFGTGAHAALVDRGRGVVVAAGIRHQTILLSFRPQ